jgi:hypothetical protein
MDQATVWVSAPPEQVWALVCDPTRYGEWSPENKGATWEAGTPLPAPPGSRFTGNNQHGLLRWTTHCTVIESRENQRFAFAVRESRTEWGFELAPDAGGTKITQWRQRTGVMPLPFRLLEASGVIGRPRDSWVVAGMNQTLQAVKRTAELQTPAHQQKDVA